jgi:hypothetical protein
MKVETIPIVPLTWAQLHDVLTKFGFQRHLTEQEQVYEEPITGTLLLFPQRRDTDTVERHHLYMARQNTINKGVADAADFDRALEGFRESVAAPPRIAA